MSERLVAVVALFCLCLLMHEGWKVSNWALCVGITGLDVWKDPVFVRTHPCLFLCCCFLFFFLIAPFLSPMSVLFTSSFALTSCSALQPSSPGDYYSSVDGDLKVELTEKLLILDKERDNGPANTEVCISLTLVTHLAL